NRGRNGGSRPSCARRRRPASPWPGAGTTPPSPRRPRPPGGSPPPRNGPPRKPGDPRRSPGAPSAHRSCGACPGCAAPRGSPSWPAHPRWARTVLASRPSPPCPARQRQRAAQGRSASPCSLHQLLVVVLHLVAVALGEALLHRVQKVLAELPRRARVLRIRDLHMLARHLTPGIVRVAG